MTKRLSKSARTNQLIVYCVEWDRAAIANASFLLAAFLLIVAGKTVAQAAELFTGPCAPYFLAPFRDVSFCRQVAPPRDPFTRLGSHSSLLKHSWAHHPSVGTENRPPRNPQTVLGRLVSRRTST
jgi:hypothetical protein